MTVSVRKRFAFTVGANLLRSLLSFVTGMLLARALGPSPFGNMSFLLGTFLALRQFLDMGSSTAFYTFMSQRSRAKSFVRGFFAWLGLQFLVPLVVIGLLFPSRWIEAIWHGEQRGLVLLALAAAFMQNSVWPAVQQMGEAQRQTVRVQGVGVAIVAAHLVAVVTLWLSGNLGLYAIFAALVVEYVLAALVVRRLLPPITVAVAGFGETERATPEPVLRSYLRYCLPLVPYAWVGFAYEFTDRWLLQRYGGSVQQAYYAVSAQFSSVALLATTSILNIFWKEIAEAHYRGDKARAHHLYRRISRVLFMVGAMAAGFLCPWAKEVLQVVLGTAYVGGATTLAIMFLYPVHQSMGQIGGTMLYATERVTLQVLSGIIFMVLSIGVTYLVLAPPDSAVPGLGLASTGLALKMVGMQLLQANVLAYLIARVCGWRFDWLYQPVGLLSCLGLGWVARVIATDIAGTFWPLPAVMTFAGVLYLPMMAALVYAMPWLTASTRDELVVDAGGALRRALTCFKPV